MIQRLKRRQNQRMVLKLKGSHRLKRRKSPRKEKRLQKKRESIVIETGEGIPKHQRDIGGKVLTDTGGIGKETDQILIVADTLLFGEGHDLPGEDLLLPPGDEALPHGLPLLHLEGDLPRKQTMPKKIGQALGVVLVDQKKNLLKKIHLLIREESNRGEITGNMMKVGRSPVLIHLVTKSRGRNHFLHPKIGDLIEVHLQEGAGVHQTDDLVLDVRVHQEGGFNHLLVEE